MNGLTWKILELAVCIMELGKLHLFLDKNCEKKKLRGIYSVLIFISCAGLLSIKDYCSITGLPWLLICFVIDMIYTLAIFKGTMQSYLIYNSICVIVIGLSESICLGVLEILLPSASILEQIMNHGDLRYIFVCISNLFSITILLMISNYKKLKFEHYSKENVWTVMLAFIISIISLYCLFTIRRNEIIGNEMETLNQAMCVLSVCIFAMNIIFYWAINKLNNKLIQEKEYELIQCQNKLLSKAVLDNEEVNSEWRKIRHDFNNHLSCIDMLLQMDNIPKARAYIQKLTHNGETNRLTVHTGHEIADAVISQKYLKARNDNICFEVEGEISKSLQMEDMDLCALLSNSIDNAIEATRQIEEEAKRRIHILFEENESQIKWQIINSVKENINETNQLKTTKKDVSRHGIGMISMQTTVKKYDGHMEWKCKNYHFKLSILIPVKQI